MHAEEKQECLRRHSKCEQEILSGSFRLRALRTVQTRPVSISKRTPLEFPGCPLLYPNPWEAARTAPNGVGERANFCFEIWGMNMKSSNRIKGQQKGQSHSRKYPLGLIRQSSLLSKHERSEKRTETILFDLNYLVIYLCIWDFCLTIGVFLRRGALIQGSFFFSFLSF